MRRSKKAVVLPVVVIDRGRAFGEALARLLTDMGMPAEAGDLPTLSEKLEATGPAVLLIDAELQEAAVSGQVAAARERWPRLPVLLLTSDTADGKALTAEVAAVGRVTRHCSPSLLREAVHRAGQGLAPERTGPRNQPRRPRSRSDRLARLTERETEVLRFLMTGVRGDIIADRLGISPHTVRTHVQNILAKSGTRTRFEVAALARTAGLRPAVLACASETSPERAGR